MDQLVATPPRQLDLNLAWSNSFASLGPAFYTELAPAPLPSPYLVGLNRRLAAELGLPAELIAGPEGVEALTGNLPLAGSRPLASVYSGHQFGVWAGQLGDGRAILLGEAQTAAGAQEFQLKGSGRTPYSRMGDGRAVLRSSIREFLASEAMHALGIPTTRALAVAATGEPVQRETPLPGAVLTRVAASHLRVGTFQMFAARGELDKLRALAEYSIARHDPDLAGTPERYTGLLRAVAERQAALLAMWMNVGFIHGVMNTDNMTLSGETIDYGPCAFMEAYDPAAVFSSIDHQGRYAYANQPLIARWNLARLAEALLPLMAAADDEPAVRQAVAQLSAVIDGFPVLYRSALLRGQRAKLGLQRSDDDATDTALADDWLALLQAQQVDFTLAWRRLADAADAAAGTEAQLRALFTQAQAADAWLTRWRQRLAREEIPTSDRATRMRAVNPWVIPRNHRVEEALAAASDAGDLAPFERLLAALCRPYDDTPQHAAYAEPAPAALTACYRTFCGT